MRAVTIEAIHQPVVVQERPVPEPKSGEVLVKLHAAALNHRDVWVQKGLYPGMKLGSIMGSDGAGEVVSVGEGGF